MHFIIPSLNIFVFHTVCVCPCFFFCFSSVSEKVVHFKRIYTNTVVLVLGLEKVFNSLIRHNVGNYILNVKKPQPQIIRRQLPGNRVLISLWECPKSNQGRYSFYCSIYFPSVLLPVSETGLCASSIMPIADERQRVKERGECKMEEGFLQPHVKLRWKQPHLSPLAGRLSSTSADESLSWTMSFISPPKVSAGTPSPLLPLTLLSLHRDHKLPNIKPCFQSVRCGSQCQGPSYPLLHLWRHLDGKICLSSHTPLSLIRTCIIQAATHTPA